MRFYMINNVTAMIQLSANLPLFFVFVFKQLNYKKKNKLLIWL